MSGRSGGDKDPPLNLTLIYESLDKRFRTSPESVGRGPGAPGAVRADGPPTASNAPKVLNPRAFLMARRAFPFGASAAAGAISADATTVMKER
jgi:hypothetical protein